jgi:hypothetical protein
VLGEETGFAAAVSKLQARSRRLKVNWTTVLLLLSFLPYAIPEEQRPFLWQVHLGALARAGTCTLVAGMRTAGLTICAYDAMPRVPGPCDAAASPAERLSHTGWDLDDSTPTSSAERPRPDVTLSALPAPTLHFSAPTFLPSLNVTPSRPALQFLAPTLHSPASTLHFPTHGCCLPTPPIHHARRAMRRTRDWWAS